MVFCSYSVVILSFEADCSVILFMSPLCGAGFAVALPFILLHSEVSVFILLLMLSHEADSAAMLPLFLLCIADSAAILFLTPLCKADAVGSLLLFCHARWLC